MTHQSRLNALAERRAGLVAQCDAQRAQIAHYFRQVEAPVRLFQAGLGMANSLRRSPLFIAGMAAVLMRTPWRRAARFPKLVWRGWQVLQLVRRWVR